MRRVIVILCFVLFIPFMTPSCEAVRGFGRTLCENSEFIADEGAKMLEEVPIVGGFFGAGWKFVVNTLCKAITVPTEVAGGIGDTVDSVLSGGDDGDSVQPEEGGDKGAGGTPGDDEGKQGGDRGPPPTSRPTR